MNPNFIFPMIALAVIAVGALVIYLFNLDKQRRVEVLKEWLLLAVVQAEKELGGGTGQVKLRFVYDLFLDKFKWLSNFISFEFFSLLVDEALDKMKSMLETNQDLYNYVNNKGADQNGRDK